MNKTRLLKRSRFFYNQDSNGDIGDEMVYKDQHFSLRRAFAYGMFWPIDEHDDKRHRSGGNGNDGI